MFFLQKIELPKYSTALIKLVHCLAVTWSMKILNIAFITFFPILVGPERIHPMKRFGLSALFSLTFLALWSQQNVVLIIADDFGKDYCGFYEEAKDTANMPNIRSLLERGVRFTNAWSNPICSPARAGMLTGRFAFRTGVGTAISGAGYGQLDTAEKTLPRLIKQYAPADYAAANIGKWHLNQQNPASLNYPNLMGYDWYEGNFLGELTDYYNWKKIKNGQSSTITNYATTETVDNAIDWLESIGPKPFFLWLGFNAPHTPFHKPPDALHTVPGLTGTTQHINQNPKLYFKAMTEAMDTETGRLFDWLKQQGKWENTTVIFIGDNGNARKVSQNPDTSQSKGTLYEYGINIPFIISGPSVAAPNRVNASMVSTVDLFATILEITGATGWPAGIPSDKPVDAVSLTPILQNQAESVRNWNFSEIFSPTPAYGEGKTMRDSLYKLIRYDQGGEALFRLPGDPMEQQQLLTAPLSAEAQAHYDWLCNQMGTLLGTPNCTTGSTELPLPQMQIAPNPASGEVVLTLPGAYSGVWHFSDIRGRVVRSGIWEGDRMSLEINELPQGVYVAEVRTVQGAVFRGKVFVRF